MKICTLSGTSEIGRNCSFIEQDNEILIIDMGLSFPDQQLYGIDYVIPNLSYLVANKKKIKAILLTHGHLDHTGALPYALPMLDFPPIYAGRFANGLVKDKLKEFGLDKKTKLIDANRNEAFNIGHFDVKFIGVTHSIPDSFALFIKPNNRQTGVFISGDYKFDKQPMGEKETDYQALKDLQGKIDLALLESTYATTPGHSKTGQEISDNLEKVISSHKGRVVVASFSSLIGNIYALFKIAQRTNRKIVLSGFSLRNAVKIAREQNFITVPDNLIVPERNVDKVNPNNLLFLCTGSQGEKYAALNRISLGEHNHFKVKKGDLIILSASEIPGNENAIGKMTDRLIEKGADIIKNSMADIYESGHGMLGDMKDMFDLIKPSEVMPIHGNLTKRYQNKQNYISWGMDPDRVHLTSDGQFWDFDSTNRRYKKATQIPSRPLMVDGLGITEGGDVVIKDRQQLAEYGFIVVMLNIGKPSNKLMGHVKFISRGFVYSNNARDLYNNLDKEIKAVHSQWLKVNSRSDKDFEKLKDMVTKKLDFIIKKKTLREPIVLVTIF